MRNLTSIFIFASAFIAVAFAYPGAANSKRDVEIDEVGPIIVLSDIPDPLDDGFPGGFFGIRENPFNGFMDSMQSMMNKLRQRIAQSIPTYSDQGGFFGFSNLPEGANTTSTTKIINGHVVTVNETTYSDGDDQQGSVVRIRIVDIKPEVETETETGNPEAEEVTVTPVDVNPQINTDRSPESVENIADNEIPERFVNLASV